MQEFTRNSNSRKLRKIATDDFQNCSNLETIYLYNTNLANMSGIRKIGPGCTALQSIYVPSEALEEYKASDFWTASSACISKIPNEKEK